LWAAEQAFERLGKTSLRQILVYDNRRLTLVNARGTFFGIGKHLGKHDVSLNRRLKRRNLRLISIFNAAGEMVNLHRIFFPAQIEPDGFR
jgi:hypothetical protein